MKEFTPLLYLFIATVVLTAYYGHVSDADVGDTPVPKVITLNSTSVHGTAQEQAKCSFEKPIKHLTLIMHWYSDREELNADFLTLAAPNDFDQVWGWSNCVWQPEDDAAFCDVYAVQPTFVYEDMDIDTIGHEVFHAACADFHD